MKKKKLHLHLVSDATGETVHQVARAALSQFSAIETVEHIWTLVRTQEHVETIGRSIKKNPGIVLYSIVNESIRKKIEEISNDMAIPSLPILDPIIQLFGDFIGQKENRKIGAQHIMNKAYFDRMAAVEFAVTHDDGMNIENLEDAQMLLVGVSRTSKTPTSIYLANRGYKVANYALVPNVEFPINYVEMKSNLFIVGLTTEVDHLVNIRKNRLDYISDTKNMKYVDTEIVNQEIIEAKRLFQKNKWPMINVSRKSIEETAATIIFMFNEWKKNK
tara:strand:- start:203 stop:1027 length:825 start_codon:yes stop_codon:yes gene_type:complete